MNIHFQTDIPLAPYSTFRIGGNADYFHELKNFDELTEIFVWIKEKNIPYLVIGGGSNILFSEKGFRGLVIRVAANGIKIDPPKIQAEAGTLTSQLVQTALQNNLEGLEPWIGLPGTVGGAIFGNAGCNGVEAKDVLIEANLFDVTHQTFRTVDRAFFEYRYRESRLKNNQNYIVCSGTFALKSTTRSKEERQKQMMQILRERQQKQPKGQNAGSFFKNPRVDTSAGYLIDRSGCKGMRIGDAAVSDVHGNFFMNLGNATQKDMLTLASMVKQKVKEKFGIALKEEVRIIA